MNLVVVYGRTSATREREREEERGERNRIFFSVNRQRQNMMEAAGNGDTVTRSFYGIKIDLSWVCRSPAVKKAEDFVNDSLCPAVIIACTSHKCVLVFYRYPTRFCGLSVRFVLFPAYWDEMDWMHRQAQQYTQITDSDISLVLKNCN